nr:hypothetical protein [Quisquiliibacterium transsilvanicum]
MGKQRVNRADLYAGTSAGIAQGRRRNMILAVWLNQREGGKPLDDLSLRLGARESLQQFLKHQTCCDKDLGAEQSALDETA